MGSKPNYIVQRVPEIPEDLSELPIDLQENLPIYQQILAIAPYQLFGLASHNRKNSGEWVDKIIRSGNKRNKVILVNRS